MPVVTRKIFTWCDKCETTIYVGMKMWVKGSECYCHSKCLVDSFSKKTIEGVKS